MGIDCPEDDDIPAVATDSRDADADGVTGKEHPAGVPDERPAVEPEFDGCASRNEYHAEYRAKVDAVYLADARERWEEAKPGFQEEWRRYKEEHPAPPDAPANIDEEICAHIERGCKEILETEENIVTPALARIEAEDPERMLVGLEYRCKGQDRIVEKVVNWLAAQSELTPEDALAMVKDPIRYTFQYAEDHYAEGVNTDVERLKLTGFELVELRNSWGSETYKGINSRWRVPDGGQLFEVQFHTAISFEAKQLTHQAYERIRNPVTPDGRTERELRGLPARRSTSKFPSLRVRERFQTSRKEAPMPTKITYYAIVNEFSSRERPGGVIRRIVGDQGRDDQAFTRSLKWEHTPLLYSYERGNMDSKFYEISEDEANRIVERIRQTVAGQQ